MPLIIARKQIIVTRKDKIVARRPILYTRRVKLGTGPVIIATRKGKLSGFTAYGLQVIGQFVHFR